MSSHIDKCRVQKKKKRKKNKISLQSENCLTPKPMFSPSDEKIIEYIDAGQYTIAQSSLLEKIKKHPNKTIYRALLNKILYKTGSKDKAIENNLALLQSVPNEINTVIELNEFFKFSLHFIGHCFRKLKQRAFKCGDFHLSLKQP